MQDSKNELHQTTEQQSLVYREMAHDFSNPITAITAETDHLLLETFRQASRIWNNYEEGEEIKTWLIHMLENSSIDLPKMKPNYQVSHKRIGLRTKIPAAAE